MPGLARVHDNTLYHLVLSTPDRRALLRCILYKPGPSWSSLTGWQVIWPKQACATANISNMPDP